MQRDPRNGLLPPYLFPTEKGGALAIRSFDPEKEVPWPHLIGVMQENRCAFPFMFSAPEFQLEPLFYLACRACSVPATAGTVYNMPLTREIIKRILPDMLIAPPDLAKVLLNNLRLNKIEISFRILFLFGNKKESDKFQLKNPDMRVEHDARPFFE